MWLSNKPLLELRDEPFVGQILKRIPVEALADAQAKGPRKRWAFLHGALGKLVEATHPESPDELMLFGALKAAESQEHAELRLAHISVGLGSVRSDLIGDLKEASNSTNEGLVRRLHKKIGRAYYLYGNWGKLVTGSSPSFQTSLRELKREIWRNRRNRKRKTPREYGEDRLTAGVVCGWLRLGPEIPGFAFMGPAAALDLLEIHYPCLGTIHRKKYNKICERLGLVLASPRRPFVAEVRKFRGRVEFRCGNRWVGCVIKRLQ